jgi:3',5'-cyclic AMP phosphodiesterase CpdA
MPNVMPFDTSTILHLSDLHFGGASCSANRLQSLTEFLRINNKKITHIVITGDVVESPSKGNFRKAAKSLAKLHRDIPKLNSSTNNEPRFIIVPGNHDRRMCGVISLRRFFFEYWEYFRKILKGENIEICTVGEDTTYAQEKKSSLSQPGIGTVIDPLYRLIFILFDSARKPAFLARGELTDKQIKACKDSLMKYDKGEWLVKFNGLAPVKQTIPFYLVIACLHHHLLPMPYKLSKLRGILANFTRVNSPGVIHRQLQHDIGCHLVLTGHEHYSRSTFMSNILKQTQSTPASQAGMLMLQTGSASREKRFSSNVILPPCCNLIEIKSADLQPEVTELYFDNASWNSDEDIGCAEQRAVQEG